MDIESCGDECLISKSSKFDKNEQKCVNCGIKFSKIVYLYNFKVKKTKFMNFFILHCINKNKITTSPEYTNLLISKIILIHKYNQEIRISLTIYYFLPTFYRHLLSLEIFFSVKSVLGPKTKFNSILKRERTKIPLKILHYYYLNIQML